MQDFEPNTSVTANLASRSVELMLPKGPCNALVLPGATLLIDNAVRTWLGQAFEQAVAIITRAAPFVNAPAPRSLDEMNKGKPAEPRTARKTTDLLV